MKELQLISNYPTKENIKIYANRIKDLADNGEVSIQELLVNLKFAEEVLKLARKEIKFECVQVQTYLGTKIEPAETNIKYYFEENEEWQKLEDEILKIRDKQKYIEEKIKIATKIGGAFVIQETGETILPVTKESTSSYKITLGK